MGSILISIAFVVKGNQSWKHSVQVSTAGSRTQSYMCPGKPLYSFLKLRFSKGHKDSEFLPLCTLMSFLIFFPDRIKAFSLYWCAPGSVDVLPRADDKIRQSCTDFSLFYERRIKIIVTNEGDLKSLPSSLLSK